MGGTAVHLTGPCFDKTDILKCSFGDEKDINGFILDNRTAICVSPRFEDIGWKHLTLLVIRKYTLEKVNFMQVCLSVNNEDQETGTV